jgi:hypothetical protein
MDKDKFGWIRRALELVKLTKKTIKNKKTSKYPSLIYDLDDIDKNELRGIILLTKKENF